MKERSIPPVISLVNAAFAAGRASPVPLYLQLCNLIRRLILEERFAAEMRLPASRVLARDLDVSRTTVELAYDQLVSEGFIERRRGSGTYVVDIHPSGPGLPARVGPALSKGNRIEDTLSNAGRRVVTITPFREDGPLPAGFAPCMPSEESFPIEVWNRTLIRTLRDKGRDLQRPTPIMGDQALRAALAKHLARTRSVQCSEDRIMIVSSTQQALHMLAHLLLDPADAVWFEEPGYLGARAVFSAAGAQLIPVPVDEQGMTIQAGHALAPDARLAYVTPSHQYPTGVTLAAARRVALLQWASATNSWVIEDDYDSEFRHVGRPLAPLQSIDQSGRVIYIGTFNKVLFPGLCLAYVVLPEPLIGPAKRALEASAGQASTLLQATVAAFMDEGHFAAHLRRSRDVYRARRRILQDATARHLEGLVTLGPTDTGLHVCAWLDTNLSDTAVSHQAAQADLHVPPLSPCYLGKTARPGLIVGYANVDERAIRRGIAHLASLLQG